MFKYLISKIYCVLFFFYVFLYRLGLLRTFSFKGYSIISIGNLSVGGTGKTPMVILFSKILTNLNIKHAIVSRGYKKRGAGEVVVSDGKNVFDDSLFCGDEPVMLATLLPGVPVVVGNKINAIKKIIGFKKYKTIIIDDGFQTFKIKKDLNCVLLDLSKKQKDYRLIPLGLLREPLSGLVRSDFVFFTKGDGIDSYKLKSFLSSYINLRRQIVLESSSFFSLLEYKKGGFVKINSLVAQPVISFSGIENPQSFINETKKKFSNISYTLVFRDHHNYNKKDVMKIKSLLKSLKADSVVTTMKDFVKIKKFFLNFKIYVVHVDFEINNKDVLVEGLKKLAS